MAAVISKGIVLGYFDETEDDYIFLKNLQEIPELGGDTESIEITTLADEAHTYTNGIKNYGDSLVFKFLYDTEQFETLNGAKFSNNKVNEWKVSLPDGVEITFNGASSVKLDGVGINSALTYTLSIKPTSAMVFGN